MKNWEKIVNETMPARHAVVAYNKKCKNEDNVSGFQRITSEVKTNSQISIF